MTGKPTTWGRWDQAGVNGQRQYSDERGLQSLQILAYIAAAIAGREYGKFVFTRSVSAMLELITAFGEGHGLSREEMSHVSLESIVEIGVESGAGR